MCDGAGPFWAYVVENQDGRFYVGHTDCLERCVEEYTDRARAKSKYRSKQAGPWTLVYHETFENRSQAMRRERALKSGQGRQWLDQKLGRASPPEAD